MEGPPLSKMAKQPYGMNVIHVNTQLESRSPVSARDILVTKTKTITKKIFITITK